MSTAFTIDGVSYPGVMVTSIRRSFQVLDGKLAGRVISGDMVRDVIGTYYNYEITVDASEASLATYDALYEVISSPDDFHTMTMPYGQSVHTFQAYVTTGSDDLSSMEDGRNLWQDLSFSVIAKSPKRRRPA